MLLEIPAWSSLDWPSLGWVLVLAGLTAACLRVKARFPEIAAAGKLPAALAHVVVGYFSVGMMAFGVTAATNAYFPVPGGSAWEGSIAVVGGIAALTIGSCTLLEHVARVRVAGRQAAATPAVAD
jgi:hypothetical protein